MVFLLFDFFIKKNNIYINFIDIFKIINYSTSANEERAARQCDAGEEQAFGSHL